ncbi:MAG: hypothetical protein RLP09_30325 [Sandaracinaceae bacterium]
MNVIRSYAPIGALMVAFALVGCDGETEMMDGGPDLTDAGPTDAGDPADTGVEGDGGVDGGMDEDSGVGCGADEAEVRGVCVATCGADTSGWDAALDESLTVVATFCSDAARFGAHAGDPAQVFTLRSESVAGGTRFDLATFAAMGASEPTESPIGSVMATHAGDVMAFLGGYLAVSPDASRALFGYTVSDSAFSGQVFSVVTMDGAHTDFAADGNFDAAWMSDDTLLVNGMGFDGAGSGQGLYAARFGSETTTARVGTGLGNFSGGVAVGPDYVLAGGFFDDGGRVYVVATSAIEAALTTGAPIDFEAVGVRVGEAEMLPSSFDLVNDMIVVQVLTPSFDLDGLRAYPVDAFDATSGITLGAPLDLTSGNLFDVAHEAGSGRMLLEFAGGLLLVE